MATFVLVHGAWHWGGCWDAVRLQLEAQGHSVYTPSLSMQPIATLDSHIRQVVAVFQEHDLVDVVLVGHSYAGVVVAGALACEPQRIQHTIFLDAFLPAPELSLMGQLMPRIGVAALRALTRFNPTLPAFISARGLGIRDPQQAQWVDAHLQPHPAATVFDPFNYTPVLEPARCTYITCRHAVQITGTDTLIGRLFARLLPASPLAKFARQAAAQGWVMRQLNTGHDAMVIAPQEVTQLFLEVLPSAPQMPTAQAVDSAPLTV
ncbi:MAG: alpha/beta hydrolase [Chloroflexi bacterium SZAS-1]|jgi:pimeloyl-ACP methyl ester carboxylesterase|nr:alpha/beta hydrolase [Chloroflexi bacterium SZAS-1]